MTLEHCVLSAAFDREVTTCRDLCVQKHPDVELTDPRVRVSRGHRLGLPQSPAALPPGGRLRVSPRAVASRLPRLPPGVQRPRDKVAEVTAAYRSAIDAVAAGGRPDTRAIRALSGGAFTRGHFARAV
jgi:putative protease